MRVFIVIILLLSFWGCLPSIPPESPPPREAVFFREKELAEPLTDDGERDSLQLALGKSLAYLENKKSSGTSSGSPAEGWGAMDTHQTLTVFRELLLSTLSEAERDRKIRENFKFLEITYGKSTNSILLTGYYEPIIEGSLGPGGEYQYPIYRRPDDLVELPSNGSSPKGIARMENGQAVPYYSRREIDSNGVLQGKGLELAWLKDPWERFVLHIQGSGQIRLADGKVIRVGFAASNGRAYRSIGRYLIDQGFLSEKGVSLERIREFIQKSPDRGAEIYNINERYIFFRPLPEAEGALGALGVPLTPGRSIATDLSIFPPGALAYLISRQPEFDGSGKMVGWKPLRRFVLNQDTGAAMKGPLRVDLFFGTGEKAGRTAGEMKEEGRIFFLLAK